MTESSTLLNEIVQSRKNIYKFLASIYAEPPPCKLIERLKNNDFISELKSIFQPKRTEEINKLLSSLNGIKIDSLKQEFMDLFMVPTEKYVAPYESVYVDEKEVNGEIKTGLLNGLSTLNVKKFYEKAGLTISENFKELPDHISCELSFMHYLVSEECISFDKNDSERLKTIRKWQKSFIENHINRWVPQLCNKILKHTDKVFYKIISIITLEFIENELETLDGV